MKRKYYITLVIALIVIIAFMIFRADKTDAIEQLKVKVERGDFEVLVTTTGELQAISSVDIKGPSKLRNSRGLRIRDIKIQDLVPEGTVVDSGDYVGELDRSEIGTSLKDQEDELEKVESQYLNTQLDTTMQLRELRDQLVNLKFAMEEKQIVLDQSKFEPPATIRQSTIDLEKAERSYAQARDTYSLKVQQAKASMREAAINLAKARRKVRDIRDVIDQFIIYAPQAGMVIYKKEGNGQKRKIGSVINPWNLTIATLPDLSKMNSKTYVNEIDISKVVVGQEVRIGIDAFPDRKYTGQVIDVANIGEQLQNTDAKVFEVLIGANETDSIMRPAMTTSNQIITSIYEDVLFLPLEAIHNDDSLNFVYTSSHKKQIIIPGETNENYIIVEQGLNEGDEIYLSVPENADKFKLSGEELILVLKEREETRLREQKERNEREERVKREKSAEKKYKKANGQHQRSQSRSN